MVEYNRSTTHVLSPVRWRRQVGRVLRAVDGAVIAISSLLAYVLRVALGDLGLVDPLQNEIAVALGVLPVWLVVLASAGAQRPEHLSDIAEGSRRYARGTVVGVLIIAFVSYLFELQVSRLYVGFLAVLVLSLGLLARVLLRARLRRGRRDGRWVQRVLLLGTDSDARDVAAAMQRSVDAGYEVVGFLADTDPVGTGVVDGLEVVGGLDDVLALCAAEGVGLVVASPGAVPDGLLRDLTVTLEGSDIDLAVAPSLFEVVTRRVSVESVGHVPLIHVHQVRLRGLIAMAKRAVDVVGSVVLLAVFSLPMLLASIAVRVDSAGPVLFTQERVGRNGRTFRILKFRTMVQDAEDRLDDLEELNEAGQHFFKIRQDPRITRVGRFLRKWSLDETPQFLNVLRGDMSLVGPRPALPSEVARYADWHRRRLRVRPGITGVWQVSGRSNVPFDEAVRMDIFYIENWSVGYDVTLLLRTVAAVLGRTGAY